MKALRSFTACSQKRHSALISENAIDRGDKTASNATLTWKGMLEFAGFAQRAAEF